MATRDFSLLEGLLDRVRGRAGALRIPVTEAERDLDAEMENSLNERAPARRGGSGGDRQLARPPERKPPR